MSKTVVITGTSSGIGKSTVEAFANAGWEVIATMRNPEKEQAFEQYPNVEVLRLDVNQAEQVEEAFHFVHKKYGRLDVVVNNAGYGVDGIFEAMDDEVISRQFETNVFGLMRVTREAIKHMRVQGHGTIIQVSSMGGRLTFPLYSIYHGTKWAVEGFTESLQYELAPIGIRMKIIEPGAIKTDFYNSGRVHVNPAGITVYDSFVKKVSEKSMEAGKNGASPDIVARAIVRAANDKGSRLRYRVGNPAPLLLALRRLLPERWFFALIRSAFGI